MIIEVAVDEFEHAKRAEALGADRIELCANLNEGGTTPSAGLIQLSCQQLNIPVHVMIRCRPGNFNYSDNELKIMMHDILLAAQAGAKGVVFGLLSKNDELDIENNKRFVNLAKDLGLHTTFHRAFDVCENPDIAFEQIVALGFNHLLTSGHAVDAINGISYIEQMVKISNDKVNIMAGKGVNPDNAYPLMKTKMNAIHFTCRKPLIERNNQITEGSEYIFDDEKLCAIIAERNRYENNSSN